MWCACSFFPEKWEKGEEKVTGWVTHTSTATPSSQLALQQESLCSLCLTKPNPCRVSHQQWLFCLWGPGASDPKSLVTQIEPCCDLTTVTQPGAVVPADVVGDPPEQMVIIPAETISSGWKSPDPRFNCANIFYSR